MTVKEEWDRAFLRILPVASVGLGVFSVAMTFLTLQRYGSLGRRSYSQDGRYLVSVRYPGQWHDIREFIQPDNPDVAALYSQVGPDLWALYDWVCRNIDYRRDIGEMWQFPSETLASNWGDCEDTSFLLCSLLQNAINAHVALGSFQGYGHAWCQLNGEILETTYTLAKPVPDPQDYVAFILFNEREVIELWPGALGEIFDLRRDEAMKLALMAEVVECMSR